MPRTTLDKVGLSKRRFNDWLRGEMRMQGVTQETLAEYIGVSRVTFGSCSRGKSEWRFRDVLKLVDYFEADLTEIL